MQDTRNGELREIDIATDLESLNQSADFNNRIADLMKITNKTRQAIQKAGEEAGIPVEYQGPVFQIDEVITIKGANFRIRGFEGGLLHLEGIK